MKVIDRTKAVFLNISLEEIRINKKRIRKKPKHTKILISESLLYLIVLHVLCVCFLYKPFCHGALIFDLYIVYTILSLNISSIDIDQCFTFTFTIPLYHLQTGIYIFVDHVLRCNAKVLI